MQAHSLFPAAIRAAMCRCYLLFAMLACGFSHAADRPLRLSSEGGYPPFSDFDDNHKLVGLDVDVGNAICAAEKLQCLWVKIDWEAMIPALIANRIDVIVASMNITDERKKLVAFTKPYYAAALGFVVAKDRRPAHLDAAALRGWKIGVERGTVADDYVTRFWADHGIELIRYRLQDEVYVDLAAGRLDGSMTDYWQALGGFLNLPEGAAFALAGGQITGVTADERRVIGEGVGIALRKEDADLRKAFDRGLATIIANGVHRDIMRKYFQEDIVTVSAQP